MQDLVDSGESAKVAFKNTGTRKPGSFGRGIARPKGMDFQFLKTRCAISRIAGNVTTPEVIASLEYGAAVLGTRVILVLGHSNCGAVAATIKGSAAPGQISALYPRIRPAVDLAGPNTEAAAKANAMIHAK